MISHLLRAALSAACITLASFVTAGIDAYGQTLAAMPDKSGQWNFLLGKCVAKKIVSACSKQGAVANNSWDYGAYDLFFVDRQEVYYFTPPEAQRRYGTNLDQKLVIANIKYQQSKKANSVIVTTVTPPMGCAFTFEYTLTENGTSVDERMLAVSSECKSSGVVYEVWEARIQDEKTGRAEPPRYKLLPASN